MTLEGVTDSDLVYFHELVQNHMYGVSDRGIGPFMYRWRDDIANRRFWSGFETRKKDFFSSQYSPLSSLLEDSETALRTFLLFDFLNGSRSSHKDVGTLADAVQGYSSSGTSSYGDPKVKVALFQHLAARYGVDVKTEGEFEVSVVDLAEDDLIFNPILIMNPRYRFGLWFADKDRPARDSYKLIEVSREWHDNKRRY